MAITDALLRIVHDAAGNFEHARQCHGRGAALGDAMCFHALGYLLDPGEGVAADEASAMKSYRRAWRRGDRAAALNIATLYRERGDKQAMFRWYERVARAGDGGAPLGMAKCYPSGTGAREDMQAAPRCLAVASASDYITGYEHEEAQTLLATSRLRLSS